MKNIAPVFTVNDVAQTLAWYSGHLGFDAVGFPEDCPDKVFGRLTKGDVCILLQQIKGFVYDSPYDQRDGGVWNAYINVEQIEPLYDRLKDKVRVVCPLHDQHYGIREFEIADCNGYVLCFAQPTA